MQFVHCNICGDRYDPVVGHLLLPDAMPALNAVHLLPRCISNRAHCHLLPAVGFSLYERQFGPWPTYWLLGEANAPNFQAFLALPAFDKHFLSLHQHA
jgi:hypothetical protein